MEEQKAYVNPIPMVDLGKQFEMRFTVRTENLTTVDGAISFLAGWIKDQPVETLAKYIKCTDVRAVYPKDLTPEERIAYGIDPISNERT